MGARQTGVRNRATLVESLSIGWIHLPLRIGVFTNHPDVAELSLLTDDLLDPILRFRLHGIAGGLRFPGGYGQKRSGVIQLAMQSGAARARRLLDDPTGAQPGIGVLLCRIPLADVDFEDKDRD